VGPEFKPQHHKKQTNKQKNQPESSCATVRGTNVRGINGRNIFGNKMAEMSLRKNNHDPGNGKGTDGRSTFDLGKGDRKTSSKAKHLRRHEKQASHPGGKAQWSFFLDQGNKQSQQQTSKEMKYRPLKESDSKLSQDKQKGGSHQNNEW
jgi:hypothetical protein